MDKAEHRCLVATVTTGPTKNMSWPRWPAWVERFWPSANVIDPRVSVSKSCACGRYRAE